MTKTHVFAYGSNLDPERMCGRAPSARVVGPSTLRGFQLRFHKRGWRDGTAKANAFRTDAAGDVLHGVVYEIDERELSDLDVHETGYERRLLDFEVSSSSPQRPGGTATHAAWVYLAEPDLIDDDLLATRWYLKHVIEGARAHGLPRSLVEWLERQPTLD